MSEFKSQNTKGERKTVRLLHWQNIVQLATLHAKGGYRCPPVRVDMDLRDEKVAVAINALERRAERQDIKMQDIHYSFGC